MRAHDQGFVPAPPGRVYAALADPAGYARWWPGARADVAGERGVRIGRGAWVGARPEGVRDGVGILLGLGRLAAGSLEWFLEPFDDGTIVNCIVELETPGGARRARRRLLRLRTAVRTGLVGLKGSLE